MTEIREDWDIDENGKRFSWRYEYSSKSGLLKREISTIGTEYKQIQYYQYDSQGRLKHIFSYGFDGISFPSIQAIHQQKTGRKLSVDEEIITYDTCLCYLDNRIIVGSGTMYYSEELNQKKLWPYALRMMSPYYFMEHWYLNRPAYLTKMIERYEEALKIQELSPLCPKAKLVHRVELSSSLFPDTLPRIPQSFKKEVKSIFETMSCKCSASGANIHPEPK